MRYLFLLLILFCYFAFCYWCWFRYRRQLVRTSCITHTSATGTWLVSYASQTGQAEKIAAQTVLQLQQANLSVNLLPLNAISPADLQRYKQLLFVVSTYGEGEAPDNGATFIRRLSGMDLSGLNFSVLALGDSHYANFCGFGHQLYRALHVRGAQPAFDLIEVDCIDDSALRHWQYYLGQLSGQPHFSDWLKPGYDTWQLCERKCLNSGSPGAPVYLLRLKPKQAALSIDQWIAGDIAEIEPYNDAQAPHREYSIASTPTQGALELLVRQVRSDAGELGLGSGWLTDAARTGGDIHLRIRRNSSFHPPTGDVPMILIGNGTGIAGLRAHLLTRVERGASANWILFGERSATHDFYFRDELNDWQAAGLLKRIDVVFSREEKTPEAPRYVQDLLRPAAAELRSWVERGAAIYVCGSLHGMAQGVDDALQEILGREQLEQMAEGRRYCRDVY